LLELVVVMVEKALGKLKVVRQETLVVEMADTVSILGMLVAEHLGTLVEEMLLKEGSLLELVVEMVEKALGKLEVVRQETLVVEMADTVSILGILVAEHLETPVEEMLEVVRQETLVVEMADKVSILAMLEAEHLEILAEEMLGVVR
jgi:hypothetical protein